MTTQYWLMKSEPDECSIDDALAAPHATMPWVGVRNYQARNMMRDTMRIGDPVLFYHSSCAVPGIAGLAQVASKPYADPTQFDPKSKYYDSKSDPANPRWQLIDVRAMQRCEVITLPQLRARDELQDMTILQRGNRLSITPITPQQWRVIETMMK